MTEYETAFIAVVGPSGSGKTTFINQASGSNFEIGHSLVPCTTTVMQSKSFTVEPSGRSVVLIDTPAFEDDPKSDVLLNTLVDQTRRRLGKRRLTGVVYMQAISDYSREFITRNATTLKQLCEDIHMANIVIATTCWDGVGDHEGATSEQALREDHCLGLLRMKGATVMRHDGGRKTALEIISRILENEEPALIAVLGPTGCGKTTFINEASGSNFKIGTSLYSCTTEVAQSKPFSVGQSGRRVILLDTPGFDDTTRSDFEILKVMANYLEKSYRYEKKVLAGVIYLQDISHTRLTGANARGVKMFRKICGEASMSNVVIATTFWQNIPPEIGASREEDLKGDGFFGRALKKGATMMRQDGGKETAMNIISKILMEANPQPLRIQKQMVDKGKVLSKTDASRELSALMHEELRGEGWQDQSPLPARKPRLRFWFELLEFFQSIA